jgi:hypothetical protein
VPKRRVVLRILKFFAFFVAAVSLADSAQSQDYPALSEGTAIVTGTRAETRAEGLAHALRDVLVKRSGNTALLRDPRLTPMETKAESMLDDYIYLDRFSDQPHHDEQGTRDRPYNLIARFSPTKLDSALAELGEEPWLTARPKLVVHIKITDRRSTFPMTADGDNDERHRQALLAAAMKYGMHLVLLPSDQVNVYRETPDALVVTGTLRWSDAGPGWEGDWLARVDRTWGVKGVSFDDAYRNLVHGAIAIASGHALPPATP